MKRAQLWPIAIVLVLLITVGANLWVMRIASADPSFAIEPDYYAQAVRWDSTLAQQARNRALGWRLEPTLRRDAGGGADLRVRVVDAGGVGIHDATVLVTAFAVARSARRMEIALVPGLDGYSGHVDAAKAHAGRWELRFDVRRGADRLTSTQRVVLGTTGAVPAPQSQ